ncbi:MAG: hypothetical protein V4610_08940 [Pseudomonadota bacterium]|jgi:uncharacterized membrane protein YqjE|nr:hypothetical protein [Sphingomonas sp. 3P27F8]
MAQKDRSRLVAIAMAVLLAIALIAFALYGLARLVERIPWSGLG